MYPSTDNKVGLGAYIDRREKLSPSTHCLLEAIKITLECNNSTFNNKHYRQNRGTAMGTHNACSYVDLAMTTIDHKILDTNTRPNDTAFPPDWSRFRDDCFSPWFAGVPALLKFTEWLNSISDIIKLTVKYSEVQLEVLDTLLFIINGRIESKVYFKSTDGHMYLLPQSSHHPSLYRNIPCGVALRLRRICSRLKNNLKNTIRFSSAGSTKVVLLERVLIRPRTLHALIPYCLNREPMIPNAA